MFCDNAQCSKKTFSECHAFVGSKGQKTIRLEKRIIRESIQLSSINASIILKSENIDVRKSSMCALLKKCRPLWISCPSGKSAWMTLPFAKDFHTEP